MNFILEKDGLVELNPKIKPWLVALSILVIALFNIVGIVMIIVGIIAIKQHFKHTNFMRSFALQNNFEYVKDTEKVKSHLKTLSARIFKTGHSKRISHLIKGEKANFKTNIFNYYYTIGNGKNSQNYSFTISEIILENTQFPHIFLKSDKMWHHTNRDLFGQDKDTRIKLENPYEKYFNLYCTQDYEIEVLQIFTKELLDYLIEYGNKFSIEFFENKIYIYDNKILTKEKDMTDLYEVMSKLIKKSGGLLNRLGNDFEAMRNSYGRG